MKIKLSILALVIVIISAMTTLRFEVVTPGNGVIVGGAGDIDIVTPDSGFINILNIKVGDVVEKGDILFSYNNLDVYYRNDSLVNMAKFLVKKKNSIISDIEGMEKILTLSSDFNENVDALVELNPGSNSTRYIREFKSISRKMIELDISEKMNLAERKELEYQMDLIRQKIDLLQRSNSPRIELIESQKELASLSVSLVDLDVELLNMKVDIRNEIDRYQVEILEKLNILTEEIYNLDKELLEVQDSLSLAQGRQKANIITSPVDGSVLNIEKQFTVGSYIESSQTVMKIKQSQSDSLIKAKVQSQYRPFISLGSEAKIVVSSPGFKQTLIGKINSISVDSFDDDKNPNIESRYYEVEVVTNNSYKIDNELIGVQVNIYIVSDKVTVFEFITATIAENIHFGAW